jgi:hypothetical protein
VSKLPLIRLRDFGRSGLQIHRFALSSAAMDRGMKLGEAEIRLILDGARERAQRASERLTVGEETTKMLDRRCGAQDVLSFLFRS